MTAVSFLQQFLHALSATTLQVAVFQARTKICLLLLSCPLLSKKTIADTVAAMDIFWKGMLVRIRGVPSTRRLLGKLLLQLEGIFHVDSASFLGCFIRQCKSGASHTCSFQIHFCKQKECAVFCCQQFQHIDDAYLSLECLSRLCLVLASQAIGLGFCPLLFASR